MSIDIHWDTLTGGPDGEALAESIRAFVHDRFQQVALPRMLRSVNVHTFEFGRTPPEIELKDVCDPLPDFYEDDQDGNDVGNEPSPSVDTYRQGDDITPDAAHAGARRGDAGPRESALPARPLRVQTDGLVERSPHLRPFNEPRAGTPRFMGGMSNLGYFHLPLSAGLSGTSTPLAAVASGAQYSNWLDPRQSDGQRDRTTSFGSVTPPSRPTSQHQSWLSDLSPAGYDGTAASARDSASFSAGGLPQDRPLPPVERSPDDLQVVARISYAGDVKLSLTCEILLDYPMESFVGIPLQLNITGLTFNGVGVLAYIRKGGERKAHFCFLAPEDAEAVIGRDGLGEEEESGETDAKALFGGLIEEIKVESEIGQKDGGRQVLKNVGKVEKFILEQVRRIFEDEFVYPSFWTFLV